MKEKRSISLDNLSRTLFQEFLEDDKINEICYNGTNIIFTQDYKSKWHKHIKNIEYKQIMAFANAVASFKKDKLEPKKPILSATLSDGERIQIVIPPVTKTDRVSITIRKPSKIRYTMKDYSEQGLFKEIVHLTENKINPVNAKLVKLFKESNYEDFIIESVKAGKNIIISGATGSGKTTFMKSLIDFIPSNERLITIEDTEEIIFEAHENYVQLFYPSEAKADDLITSASLLKSCLRMKPDRILLAELRGAETYDFLNVVGSGHNGSMSSCHAGSVEETFTRLAYMVLKNKEGQKIPFNVIENNLKEVIDIVIHMSTHQGKRVITDIYFKEIEKDKTK